MKINRNRLEHVEESDIDENGEFTIPEGITVIGDRAFSDLKKLKRINNLSQIKEIEEYAFSFCKSLESFYIGDLLERIDEGAFASCPGIQEYNISPNNENFIVSDGCLYAKKPYKLIGISNKIEILNIPEGVERVDSVFEGSNLREINFPSTIKFSDSTDFIMFCEMHNLEKINFSANHPKYLSKEGIVYDEENKELIFCPAKVRKLVILDDIQSTMFETAFSSQNNLEYIFIPSLF